MADLNPNIKVNIDTSDALASLRALQREIADLNKKLAQSSSLNAQQADNIQRNLLADINSSGKFAARLTTIKSSTEAFTESLEKNKLSMGEYFRYGIASTKTFGGAFKAEMGMLDKVARERVKTLQTQFISMGRDANGALKAISVRPLKLDLNDLATQQAINAQKQQIFNQLLKQGSTNLLNFGKNTQWAGRQLMVGFTIPLSIFGSTAAKAFMDLEEQAVRFKRVYGDLLTPPEESGEMLETLKELGLEFTKYGVALKDTMSLAADAAAMGKEGAELTAQVTEATRLAVLGEVSQQQALETSISLTNAFGYSTEQLASKIDFLNAVENQTVTSIEDLTEAIPKAGPVIEQLGGGVEDLAFFLTAMKEGGINASEGANALKSGLASLINPTGQAADMFMSLGINIRELVRDNAGDVRGLVVSVAQALDELAPQQRAQAIEQMFGKFQFARISALFSNVTAQGNQASRVLDLMSSSTSELANLSEKELKRIEESTTYKFRGAIDEFNAALAPIGEEFLKLITPIIEVGTKILEQFNKMSDGGKQFVIGLITVLGGIAPVALMTFGLIANGVANVIKGFATLRGFFLGLTTDSQTLGQSVDYMTQQQLEASAAAASLDQKHQQLIQTFTAEKGAVLSLGDAYYRAASSMSALATGNAIPSIFGGGAKPKGYANGGVIQGPGGEKSDIIPIMASKNETILSAKLTKKYWPLIQGILADNIPGFANSGIAGQTGSLTAGYSVRSGSESMVDNLIDKIIRLGGSVEDVTKVLDRLKETGKPISGKAFREQAGDLLKSNQPGLQLGHLQLPKGILPSGERASGSLVRAMIPSQNKALDAGGQTVSDFTRDWNSVVNGLAQTIELGGEELTDEMRQIARDIDKEIHDIAVEIAKAGDGLVTDEILSDAAQKAIKNNKSAGGSRASAAKALENTADMDVVLRATTQGLKDSQALKEAGIVFGSETYDQMVRELTSKGLLQEITTSGGRKSWVTTEAGAGLTSRGTAGMHFARERSDGTAVPQGRYAAIQGAETYLDLQGKVGATIIDAVGDDIKAAAQVKSPSRKTAQAAKGMVDGVTETIKDSKDEVSKATDEMLSPVSGKAAKKVGSRRVTTNPDLIAQYEEKKLSEVKERFKPKYDATGIVNLAEKAPQVTASFDKFNTRLSQASMAISAVTGVASMFGGQLGEVTGVLFQVSSALFGFSQLINVLPAKITSKISGALAARWAASAGANAVGSATGSILSKILPKLAQVLKFLGPVGIGLSLLAIAIPFVVNAYNEQKKKMEAFGKIIDVTAGQVEYLGNKAGVSAITDDPFQSAQATGVNFDQAAAEAAAATDEFKSQFAQQIEYTRSGAIDDITNALEMFAYELSSRGIPDKIVSETVAGIIAASERKDIRFNYARVGVSEQNKKQLLSDLQSAVSGKALVTTTTTGMYGTRDTNQAAISANKSTSASVEQSGKTAGALMSSFGAQFRGSEKTVQDLNVLVQSFKDLNEVVNSVDPSVMEDFMKGLLSNISDEPLRELISGLDSVDDQVNVLKALQSGLVDNAELTGILNGLNADARVDGPAAAQAQAIARTKLNEVLDLQKNLESDIKNIQNEAALAAIAGITAQTASIQGQIDAYNSLVDSGADAALAYQIIGDAALYTAYQEAQAAGKAAEFIVEMEKLKGVTEALNNLNPANKTTVGSGEKSDFQKAIDQLNEEKKSANDTVAAYKKLRAAKFSVAVAAAAAKDATLAAALANAKVGSKNWETLLAKIKGTNSALAQTERLLEQIDLATPEGKQEKFMEGYDKAMEAFAVMEEQINLDFARGTNKSGANIDLINTTKLEQDVRKANETIAGLNYQIDDYDAQLDGIDKQEDTINAKYEKRTSALDKIAKVNDKIAKQQKSQLSIADALSQGDIAAAARAVQEQRAQQAQDAIDAQKEALDVAKEAELGAITAANGMTRAEIDTKIAELKKQIFDIEELTLEPAQRQLEIAENLKQNAIDTLTVQGHSKLYWEALKNRIDIARVGSAGYVADMDAALKLVKAAELAWKGIESKTVTLTINEVRNTGGSSSGSSGSTGSGSASSGSGSGTGAGTSSNGYYVDNPGAAPTIGGITAGGSEPKVVQTVAQVSAKVAAATAEKITAAANTQAATVKLLSTVPGMSSVVKAMTASVTSAKKDATMLAKAASTVTAKPTSTSTKSVSGGTKIALANGGLVKYMASGGMFSSLGTDIVPAMLTPGEFVISRPAVRSFGVDRLKAINSGQSSDGSVYNYEVNVNVKSDANPDQIARAVMTEIKRVNSQQLRSLR